MTPVAHLYVRKHENSKVTRVRQTNPQTMTMTTTRANKAPASTGANGKTIPSLSDLLDLHQQGVDHFRAAQWKEAERIFQETLDAVQAMLGSKGGPPNEHPQPLHLRVLVDETPPSFCGGIFPMDTFCAPNGFLLYCKPMHVIMAANGDAASSSPPATQPPSLKSLKATYKHVMMAVLYNCALTLHAQAVLVQQANFDRPDKEKQVSELLTQTLSLYQLAESQIPSSSWFTSSKTDGGCEEKFLKLGLLNNMCHVHSMRNAKLDLKMSIKTLRGALHPLQKKQEQQQQQQNDETRPSPYASPLSLRVRRQPQHDLITFVQLNLDGAKRLKDV